jgi:hypothetical protein
MNKITQVYSKGSISPLRHKITNKSSSYDINMGGPSINNMSS